ncbi:hypothetical protein [Nocardia colli]|uniref:hypothetical protein n=1 Tax=Nocardia colli TaxID=2545717 RepID=UPI0035DBFAA6
MLPKTGVIALLSALSCTMLLPAVATADPPQRAVGYRASATPTELSIETDAGSIVAENGMLAIKSDDGTVLAGTPLSFQYQDFVFPVDARIQGRSATLTPRLDMQRAIYKPAALPFDDSAQWQTPYEREQAAFQRMFAQISMGIFVGGMLGTVGAGILGCVGGALLGGVVTGLVAFLFGAGPLGGCVVGAMLMAPFGTFVGSLVIAIPVAAASVIQYFSTINAPFTPAKPR